VTAPAAELPEVPPALRRERRGWYMYDWANAVFHTTVLSVFLGPYLTGIAKTAAGAGDFVHPLGIPVRAESFYPYVVSLSVILQVVLLPAVGAVADHSGRKKLLLAVFAYAGALCTAGLFFCTGGAYLLGGVLFLVANMAFGASITVYYSYIPDLASADDRDGLSTRGWATGYIGGGLLLALNLVLFTLHDSLGVSTGDAVRICLGSAGVWWALFTIIPLRLLRRDDTSAAAGALTPALRQSFRQLWATLKGMRAYPLTLGFLGAYLIYNDGVQTVIALAATYGAQELKLGQTTLISAILMVQFVAFGGALGLGRLAARYGAKRVVLGSLVVWAALIGCAYALQVGKAWQFYALAAGIAIVLGGTQALSRSLFSHLIPKGKEAEYFGFYQISDKGTSWLGTFVFGLTLQFTGSYRSAIITLVAFFVVGFAGLALVNLERAIRAVGNDVPAKL
jgi:UMF1 family MFS transporter